MSAGMPELGSKISLISKADIRYEGRLFTVDPQECTIALSNVRSYGTEDRDTNYPVLPQSQIYDYILFRGSDIKDIRVVQSINPIPNDPAIVTLSVPPMGANNASGFPQASSAPQQPSQTQNAGGAFAHGMLGHIGSGTTPQFGSFSAGLPSGLAPGMRIGQESRSLSSELAADLEPRQQQQQQQTAESSDLIGGRSGAGTPVSGIARKSPTMDQGVQAGAPGAVGSRPQRTQQLQQQQQRGGGGNRTMSGGDRGGEQQHEYRDNRRPQQNNRQQHGAWTENAWQHQGPRQQQHQQQHQQQQQDGWGGPNNRGGPEGWNRGGHPQDAWGQSRGGWRGGPRRGRGRGGNFPRPPGPPGQQQQGPPMMRGPQQAGQMPGGPPGPKKNVLKFEGDYDFEQANTEFENLRAQLANIKLTATAAGQLPNNATVDPSTPTPTVNAKVNGDDKKEVDSGNETGVGEGETEEEQETFYDKTKSFFDNISCEAIERSKGCSQRTDWRQERKLNSETFGVASARRGYRGRGGYYRGGGGMYRGNGGYRGGYRGRGNYNRHPGNMMGGGGPQQQQREGGHQQNRATAAPGGK